MEPLGLEEHPQGQAGCHPKPDVMRNRPMGDKPPKFKHVRKQCTEHRCQGGYQPTGNRILSTEGDYFVITPFQRFSLKLCSW